MANPMTDNEALHLAESAHEIPLHRDHHLDVVRLALSVPQDPELRGLAAAVIDLDPDLVSEDDALDVVIGFLDRDHPNKPLAWHLSRQELLHRTPDLAEHRRAFGANDDAASAFLSRIASSGAGFVLTGIRVRRGLHPDLGQHVRVHAQDPACHHFVAENATVFDPTDDAQLLAHALAWVVSDLLPRQRELTQDTLPISLRALRELAAKVRSGAPLQFLELARTLDLDSEHVDFFIRREGDPVVELVRLGELATHVWQYQGPEIALRFADLPGVTAALSQRLASAREDELVRAVDHPDAPLLTALQQQPELLTALARMHNVIQSAAAQRLLRGRMELVESAAAMDQVADRAVALALIDHPDGRDALLTAMLDPEFRSWDALDGCSVVSVSEILAACAERGARHIPRSKRVQAWLRVHPETLLEGDAPERYRLLVFADPQVRVALLEGREDRMRLAMNARKEMLGDKLHSWHLAEDLMATGTEAAVDEFFSLEIDWDGSLPLYTVRPELLKRMVRQQRMSQQDLMQVLMRADPGPVPPWDAELAREGLRLACQPGVLDTLDQDQVVQGSARLRRFTEWFILGMPELGGADLVKLARQHAALLTEWPLPIALAELVAQVPAALRPGLLRSLAEHWLTALDRARAEGDLQAMQALESAGYRFAARAKNTRDTVLELLTERDAAARDEWVEELIQDYLRWLHVPVQPPAPCLSEGLLPEDLAQLLPLLAQQARADLDREWPQERVALLAEAHRADQDRQLHAALRRADLEHLAETLPPSWTRPDLRAALDEAQVDPAVATSVLDRLHDEVLPRLFRDALVVQMERSDPCLADHVVDQYFNVYATHPQAVARALAKVLDDAEQLPEAWRRGLVFALVKLREPLGGKVPKLLTRLAKDPGMTSDFRALADVQRGTFSRQELKKQRHKRPEVRTRQAGRSLAKARRANRSGRRTERRQ